MYIEIISAMEEKRRLLCIGLPSYSAYCHCARSWRDSTASTIPKIRPLDEKATRAANLFNTPPPGKRSIIKSIPYLVFDVYFINRTTTF
jgi:hypothetical protein